MATNPKVKDSLVTVRMDSFQAALWNPERLAELERTRPGELLMREDVVRERYVVEVRRNARNIADDEEGYRAEYDWTLEVAAVDQGGAIWRIPWQVITRAEEPRDRIIAEARSEDARERAAERRAAA